MATTIGPKQQRLNELRQDKLARAKQAEKAATINKAATIKEATVKLAATINAIPAHKGKGRPSTGKALSVAERSRRYREERKRKNETG